jgi:hypothetical protein
MKKVADLTSVRRRNTLSLAFAGLAGRKHIQRRRPFKVVTNEQAISVKSDPRIRVMQRRSFILNRVRAIRICATGRRGQRTDNWRASVQRVRTTWIIVSAGVWPELVETWILRRFIWSTRSRVASVSVTCESTGSFFSAESEGSLSMALIFRQRRSTHPVQTGRSRS